MTQETNEQTGPRASAPPSTETGFTAEGPALGVVRRPRLRWVWATLFFSACLTVAAVVVLATTGVLQYAIVGYPTTPMTHDKADRIASEGPPTGSTLEAVKTWLPSQSITANPSVAGPSFRVIRRSADAAPAGKWMDQVGHQTVAECAGLKTDDVYAYVRVIYPDADRYLFGQDRITIYFFFDANDRLMKHWVDVFHVMP